MSIDANRYKEICMTVKKHYDNHLGFFYSWMMGDFDANKNVFLNFCKNHNVFPFASKNVVDLGAGSGIQSIALAELGFKITSIDFNQTLLDELNSRKNAFPIETVNDDLRNISNYRDRNPELIICCGDTIAHLGSAEEISKLIKDTNETLIANGKIILTFRDYSVELIDSMRFIPVKSDSKRILTCFLEYYNKKIRVTDLLYEKSESGWTQKISSYEKVRISKDMILNLLDKHGFNIIFNNTINGMITIIGQRNE